MMISMDMESGAWTYADPQDDAVQGLGVSGSKSDWRAPEPALGLQEVVLASPSRPFAVQHVEALLKRLARDEI